MRRTFRHYKPFPDHPGCQRIDAKCVQHVERPDRSPLSVAEKHPEARPSIPRFQQFQCFHQRPDVDVPGLLPGTPGVDEEIAGKEIPDRGLYALPVSALHTRFVFAGKKGGLQRWLAQRHLFHSTQVQPGRQDSPNPLKRQRRRHPLDQPQVEQLGLAPHAHGQGRRKLHLRHRVIALRKSHGQIGAPERALPCLGHVQMRHEPEHWGHREREPQPLNRSVAFDLSSQAFSSAFSALSGTTGTGPGDTGCRFFPLPIGGHRHASSGVFRRKRWKWRMIPQE